MAFLPVARRLTWVRNEKPAHFKVDGLLKNLSGPYWSDWTVKV
jgi:hypothetical protein